MKAHFNLSLECNLIKIPIHELHFKQTNQLAWLTFSTNQFTLSTSLTNQLADKTFSYPIRLQATTNQHVEKRTGAVYSECRTPKDGPVPDLCL